MSAKEAQDDPNEIADHIAYKPTDVEIEAARDPSIHTDHVSVDVELGDAHKTVRERVEAIVDAAHKNGVLQQITVSEADGKYHSVVVNIKPLEDWNVAGQRGFDDYHILLGVQGGLSLATRHSVMVDTRRYNDFEKLLRWIAGAD